MYLSVDIWVRLEDVRVALVLVGCFTFPKYLACRGQVVVVPVIVHKPLGFDKRNVVNVHALLKSTSHTVVIDNFHHIVIVLNVNLIYVAIVWIVTTVTWLALFTPYLDYTASCVVAANKEVEVLY